MARKGGSPGDSGGGYAERQEYMPPTDPRLGPPPDLPSLLLHNRIVYLGMALVPAVTELVRGFDFGVLDNRPFPCYLHAVRGVTGPATLFTCSHTTRSSRSCCT